MHQPDDLSFWDYVILAPALIGLFLAASIAAILILIVGDDGITASRRETIR